MPHPLNQLTGSCHDDGPKGILEYLDLQGVLVDVQLLGQLGPDDVQRDVELKSVRQENGHRKHQLDHQIQCRRR